MRSSVRTRRAVRSQSTAGTLKVGSSRKLAASSDAAAASIRSSISRREVRAKVSTTSRGRRRFSLGMTTTASSASQ